MMKMTARETYEVVKSLLAGKGNASLFRSYKIVAGPTTYRNGGQNSMVQFKAIAPVVPYNKTKDKFVRPLTFVIAAEPHGKKMSGLFKIGDIVNIIASAEPYRGKVYGKRNKPILYPDGTQRYTTKTRFAVIKMGKGIDLYA